MKLKGVQIVAGDTLEYSGPFPKRYTDLTVTKTGERIILAVGLEGLEAPYLVEDLVHYKVLEHYILKECER